MIKKWIAAFTSFSILVGILSGCSNAQAQNTSDDKPKYKIGIMTGTVAQGEEEYRAGEKMIEKYRDMIEFVTYPDNFVKEQETTIANMMQLASDPDVKAIIMCIGITGASAAFEKVRENRPDILLICGNTVEDPDMIASRVDMVIHPDEINMGYSIPAQASKMGAKTFVHYSFPRHMASPLYRERRQILEQECEKLGIQFIDETCPDPTGDLGIAGAQMFMLEDIPRKVEEYGKDTCFFNTNCSMQEPLIKAALQQGAIVVQQCCPSPFHGYPSALGIAVDPEQMGNLEWIEKAISEKIAKQGGTGRFSTWDFPVNMTIIEASVEYAIQYCEGNTNGKNDKEALAAAFDKITGGKNLEIRNYIKPSTTEELDNLYMILGDYMDF